MAKTRRKDSKRQEPRGTNAKLQQNRKAFEKEKSRWKREKRRYEV
jgi:hypothetical protein